MNLANRLSEAAAGRIPDEGFRLPFAVPFTAYIDAIVHGSRPRIVLQGNMLTYVPPMPVTERPINSQYHANYYQTVDATIRGNAVQGADHDRDVNNPPIDPWTTLSHTSMGDNPNVQVGILQAFLARTPRR
ncbi:MAG: hypothetical protein RMI91_09945 [Gemmatales bacterium]|nr:hypothetical protein [Gemmatales bacterium]MDW7994962.1 hypothetical protein [Gemmatales bacterium]